MCVVMFGTPNELGLFFRYLAACRSCARMCSQAALMGAIISAMAALDASGGEAVVVVAGLDLLCCLAAGNTVDKVSVLHLLARCLVIPSCYLLFMSRLVRLLRMQGPLMGVVESALRALDAHRGDARVARVGLGFFASLAVDTENKVRLP